MEIIKIAPLSLNYDIETDALYLEGFQVGIEKSKYATVARMLRSGEFTKEKIALLAGVDLAFVLQVERDLLNDDKN